MEGAQDGWIAGAEEGMIERTGEVGRSVCVCCDGYVGKVRVQHLATDELRLDEHQ